MSKQQLLDRENCPVCLHALGQGLAEVLFSEGKEQIKKNELLLTIINDMALYPEQIIEAIQTMRDHDLDDTQITAMLMDLGLMETDANQYMLINEEV